MKKRRFSARHLKGHKSSAETSMARVSASGTGKRKLDLLESNGIHHLSYSKSTQNTGNSSTPSFVDCSQTIATASTQEMHRDGHEGDENKSKKCKSGAYKELVS